jgi:hypothetical protein
MSKFIENSKHGQMTSAVTNHFFGSGNSEISGKASGKGFPMGGDSGWNAQGGSGEMVGAGVMNKPGFGQGTSLFNAPGQRYPAGTGVDYQPASNAGHTNKEDPFSMADGVVW